MTQVLYVVSGHTGHWKFYRLGHVCHCFVGLPTLSLSVVITSTSLGQGQSQTEVCGKELHRNSALKGRMQG